METYCKPDKGLGLLCGSITSWVCALILQAYFVAQGDGQSAIGVTEFFLVVILPLYIIFALPIALILCFTFGGVTWYIFEALRLTQRRHAILGGAIVGAFMALALFYLNENDSDGLFPLTLYVIIIGALTGYVTHYIGYRYYAD